MSTYPGDTSDYGGDAAPKAGSFYLIIRFVDGEVVCSWAEVHPRLDIYPWLRSPHRKELSP